MSWQKPSREKCPECGGYMVEKGTSWYVRMKNAGMLQRGTKRMSKRLTELHCYSENCMII